MNKQTIWIPGMRTTCGHRVFAVQGNTLVSSACRFIHAELARPDMSDEWTRSLIRPVFEPRQTALVDIIGNTRLRQR